MLALPDETVVHILAALPHTDIATAVVRVCRTWHTLRASVPFRAARADVDERGLVVAGGYHDTDAGRENLSSRVLVGGRWCEGAPLPQNFDCVWMSFLGELVLFGREDREGVPGPWCCRAFNLQANAWRALEWEYDTNEEEVWEVWDCCATDTVVVAFSAMRGDEYRNRLRSLRPGHAEGWVSIPDPPIDVGFSHELDGCVPSLCFIDDVLYLVGGQEDGGAFSDALQSFDLWTCAWTVRAPLPLPRGGYPACVENAGRLFLLGGSVDSDSLLDLVYSYDPRTDRWRTESPLPLGSYRPGALGSPSGGLVAAVHQGRVVVIGIEAVPPVALVDDVWTELPPGLPMFAESDRGYCAGVVSLRLE